MQMWIRTYDGVARIAAGVILVVGICALLGARSELAVCGCFGAARLTYSAHLAINAVALAALCATVLPRLLGSEVTSEHELFSRGASLTKP